MKLVGWSDWVGVVARDVEAQRAFYRDVVGFRELQAAPDWVWFDLGFPTLFEVIALDEARAQYDVARFQTGFSTADVNRAAGVLCGAGLEQIVDVQGGASAAGYWAYFRAPDGTVFEVSQRLGSAWPDAGGARPDGHDATLLDPPVWIGVVTERPDDMRALFGSTLGFPETGGRFDGGDGRRIDVIPRAEANPVYTRTGWYIGFGVEDVERARDELVSRGAKLASDVEGGDAIGSRWCRFYDAEENVFAITQLLRA